MVDNWAHAHGLPMSNSFGIEVISSLNSPSEIQFCAGYKWANGHGMTILNPCRFEVRGPMNDLGDCRLLC